MRRFRLSSEARPRVAARGTGPALDEDLTRWRVPGIASSEGLDSRAFAERLDLGAFFLELASDRCSGPQYPDRRGSR